MDWEAGDLLACYGRDFASRVITWGTATLIAPRGLKLGPSHVAMICDVGGRPTWIESTTFCRHACQLRRAVVRGAQAHDPTRRLRDYHSAGGRVEQYRLTEINTLSRPERQLLTRILVEHFVLRGLGYDMAGAVLSGTRLFQLTRFFPNADLESLFCSELVASVLMRLNRMNHSNPTRFHPARLLRVLVRTGKYRRVGPVECAMEGTL